MVVLPAGDIWASSYDGQILHYQGDRWTSYPIQGQAPGQEGQPLSISMLSESNGWVAGFTNNAPQGMFLAHFDGRTWTRVPGPAASEPTDIETVALVSPSEGWAGGDLHGVSETVLLHDVDGQWKPVPTPYSGYISKIVMVSAAEGWASVEGGAASGLLHYQNGLWTRTTAEGSTHCRQPSLNQGGTPEHCKRLLLHVMTGAAIFPMPLRDQRLVAA